jgi:hypothetical protein
MEIITRAQAKARGLKRYFTGKPCKRGHVAERFVRNFECVTCRNEDFRKRRAANLTKLREKDRKWRAAHRDEVNARRRAKNVEQRNKLRDRRAAHRAELLALRAKLAEVPETMPEPKTVSEAIARLTAMIAKETVDPKRIVGEDLLPLFHSAREGAKKRTRSRNAPPLNTDLESNRNARKGGLSD